MAGSGPAILLIHGIGDNSTTWSTVQSALAQRFTVIAPDLLGHGKSDKPRADYSVAAYANAEAGFYFSEGYLDPRKESAMRKETELLLGEVRASALTLVDAFGIPDVALAAPIAFMDPAHPRW